MLMEFFFIVHPKKKALQKYLHAKIDTKWVCVKKRNMAKIAQKTTQTPETVKTHNKAYFVIKLA